MNFTTWTISLMSISAHLFSLLVLMFACATASAESHFAIIAGKANKKNYAMVSKSAVETIQKENPGAVVPVAASYPST